MSSVNELLMVAFISVCIGFWLCIIFTPALYQLFTTHLKKFHIDDKIQQDTEQFIESLFDMLETSAHIEKLTHELIEQSTDIYTLKTEIQALRRNTVTGINEVKQAYYEGV